ncbi:unnamed protein product [Ranitomeya imitator]|uniref:SEC63 domain-containing protein n=1 Tax=Ranitomeya imitator TaxID=111125 RepID=A0ABN9LDT8_9NEOB|nr:unnamed protein product [Ranitomeya imitator]
MPAEPPTKHRELLLLPQSTARHHHTTESHHTATTAGFAMLDVAAHHGWLVTVLNITNLVQMVVQARWIHDSGFLTIPNIEKHHLYLFRNWNTGKRIRHSEEVTGPIECLPELVAACGGKEEMFFSLVEKDLSAAHISQAWNFVSNLPVIDVQMTIKGWWEDPGQAHDERSVPIIFPGAQEKKMDFITRGSGGKQDSKAIAPKFPKAKDEGWFLILGEVDKKELVALKRVGYVRTRSTASVAFYTPENTGRCIYTLYLMSDSYLGMDQQYDLYLSIIPASVSSQVNTEVSAALNDLVMK